MKKLILLCCLMFILGTTAITQKLTAEDVVAKHLESVGKRTAAALRSHERAEDGDRRAASDLRP